eukprot:scaffold19706_cov29-Tisochrysis_lutea.AAC.1
MSACSGERRRTSDPPPAPPPSTTVAPIGRLALSSARGSSGSTTISPREMTAPSPSCPANRPNWWPQ